MCGLKCWQALIFVCAHKDFSGMFTWDVAHQVALQSSAGVSWVSLALGAAGSRVFSDGLWLHGLCTAGALLRGMAGLSRIDKLSLWARGRSSGFLCEHNTGYLVRWETYLCENRKCERPSSSVVAADNVCVLIQCILSSAHLQVCSNLLISMEGTSVYKLQQGWCFFNSRCSTESAQRKGGASGALCWTESCSHCLVLSFFLFLQMHQHTAMQTNQLSPWEVSHWVAVQPALVVQAFEFTVHLSSCASTCVWSWGVWVSASSFHNSFLVVMIEINYSVSWCKQAAEKVKL